jgi:hypothetical protein
VIKTETSSLITVPRFFGEAPPIGSVVIMDSTGGDIQIYSAPVVSKIRKIKRYMNFYASEKDSNLPDSQPAQAEIQKQGAKSSDIGPMSPFGFADTPYGARPLAAGNGNMLFAGPKSVGMITACDSKFIIRSTGTAELSSPHMMSFTGRTVSVNAFHDNLSIEIDINPSLSSGGLLTLPALKDRIAASVTGETLPMMTFEEAFELHVSGDPYEAFYRLFGLYLAELLLTFKWERIAYRGNETTFQEVFSQFTVFQTIYIYCPSSYNNDEIASFEMLMAESYDQADMESLVTPSCEGDVIGYVAPVNAYVNGDEYRATQLTIRLRNGTTIEYAKKKRLYSLSHGIMAVNGWVSNKKSASYSLSHEINIDSISFPDITIMPNSTGFCGGGFGVPTITWGGDFLMNTLGSMTTTASDTIMMHGATAITIGGGSKGILVDSSGSSAVTL